jgi:DNA-binding response OmpR family regulator
VGKPLALIVEDQNDVSVIFAEALRAAGFEAQAVRTGDAALAWLSSNTPDVVVLDLNLPRVPGEEILNHIRADARLANTTVIVASAYPSLAESVRDEADWTLIKPVSFGQLRDLAATLDSDAGGTVSNPLALIVEDEYDIAIVFDKAVRAAGFQTEITRAGDTALAWLSTNIPDVVILDLGLPVISGEDILDHIRANGRLADTRIIIATAYSILSDGIRDSADCILIKPIGFNQLRDLAARFKPGASDSKHDQANNPPGDNGSC